MDNKIVLALLALVIAASGCTSQSATDKTVHDDVVNQLEKDKDNKQIIGVIRGETSHDRFNIRRSQWANHHDYTVKYYCFEKDDTQYCELKEAYRTNEEYTP